MKNIVEEILNDVVDKDANLSDVLRKANILAAKLPDQAFKKWIECELDCYPICEELPDYRRFHTQSYGDFVNRFYSNTNICIPSSLLIPKLRKLSEIAELREGIRGLESLIISADDGVIRWGWPQEAVMLMNSTYDVGNGFQCVSAWKWVGVSRIEQILDTVKNRLQNFVLELEVRYPDAAKSIEAIRKVPATEVRDIYMTKIEGNNIQGSNVATGGSAISDSSANFTNTVSPNLQLLLQQVRKDIEILSDAEQKDALDLTSTIEKEAAQGNEKSITAKTCANALVTFLQKVAADISVAAIKQHYGL